MKNGIYMASPEKAFLDEVYFVARGKAILDLDECDMRKLSPKKLKEYSKRFPRYVQTRFNEMMN
jgi:hypothetical protein